MAAASHARSASTYRSLDIAGGQVGILRAEFDARPFDRHFHDFPTIGLVRHGANRFRHGRKVSEAVQGEVCMVDPGEVHDGGQAGIAWSYDCLFPSPDLLNELAAPLGYQGYPWFEYSRVGGPRVRLFQQLFDAVFAPAFDAGQCRELCILALSQLICRETDMSKRDRGVGRNDRVAKEAIAYIRDNLAAPLRLEEISDAVAASPFTVIRAVAAQTGLTPRKLIIQERVERARQLLIGGMQPAAAAHEAGFADQSHLTRELKRRWGVTPGIFTH